MKKIFLFFFSLLILFSTQANAWLFDNNFVKASEFNKGIFKGFNIGELKEYDERYIEEISNTGANIVRVIIPFNFCKANNNNELNCIYEVNKENVEKLKKMNKQFSDVKIKVIISGYFYEKVKGDFWQNKMLQTAMSDSWRYFADQIKNEENIAGIEIYYAPDNSSMINPHKSSEMWSIAGYNMIKAIRSVDKNHAIIFQVPNGAIESIDNLLDLDDKNIIYGFDMFFPHQITLQGIGQYQQVLTYPLGAEYSLDPYKNGKSLVIDQKAIKEYIAPLVEFRNKGHNVIINSWGIVHYAPQGSSYRYVKDVLKIFDENSLSWVYYGFRINKALDPFIAGENIEDSARTPKASLITLLRENMKGKKDEIK